MFDNSLDFSRSYVPGLSLDTATFYYYKLYRQLETTPSQTQHLCVCVSVLPCNLGECFVLLLPVAGMNASLSDKQLWRFFLNVLATEKS